MADPDDLPEVSGYSRLHVAVAAAVGLVATALAYLWAQGFGANTETASRVDPTVEGGGIGSNWVAGNTDPMLDFLIALVHAADVIMGAFILVLLFVHWASFRQLADRMRQPGERTGDAVAADGGTTADRRTETAAERQSPSNADADGAAPGGDPE